MGDIAEMYDFDPSDLDRERPPPRCKFCGSTDVRWRQQTGRWVLFNLKAGEEHNCRSTTATPGDFD